MMMPDTASEEILVTSQGAAGDAAAFGSLDPEVASDIALLREFVSNRQRHIARLLGRNFRQSPLRDELLRLIMMAFGSARYCRTAFYVRACAMYGTEPSVRHEIDILRSAGLIVLSRDPAHPRAFLVQPTEKLVSFYNEQMPRLRSDVLRLLSNTVRADSD